jgi:hypothetical protein
MLETPSIRHYHLGGDNVSGAVNQQERPVLIQQFVGSLESLTAGFVDTGILRGHTPAMSLRRVT